MFNQNDKRLKSLGRLCDLLVGNQARRSAGSFTNNEKNRPSAIKIAVIYPISLNNTVKERERVKSTREFSISLESSLTWSQVMLFDLLKWSSVCEKFNWMGPESFWAKERAFVLREDSAATRRRDFSQNRPFSSSVKHARARMVATNQFISRESASVKFLVTQRKNQTLMYVKLTG